MRSIGPVTCVGVQVQAREFETSFVKCILRGSVYAGAVDESNFVVERAHNKAQEGQEPTEHPQTPLTKLEAKGAGHYNRTW